MVHVVDFVEGNDRCHVATPPGLGIGGEAAYDRGYKNQSIGGRAICQHMGPMSGRENHRRAATAPSSRIAAAVTFVFADRYFGAWQTDKCRS